MSKNQLTLPRRYRVKKGDEVEIIAGNDRGSRGKVLQVLRKKGRVIVEGCRMMKKHVRPTQDNPQGGVEEREGSIHVSNVKVVVSAESAKAKK